MFLFTLTISPVQAVSTDIRITDKKEKHCIQSAIVMMYIDDSKYTIVTDKCTNQAVVLDYYTQEEIEVYSPNEYVWQQKSIYARTVTRERVFKLETIPHATERTYVKTLPHRKERVIQGGQNGSKGIILEHITYKDGSKKTVIVDEWIEKEPITHKLEIGTKYDLLTTTIEGQTVSYWKTLTVLATSYDRNCYGCNDITATGAKLRKGIIAVDPRVIPLHTKMYVPGYGFGQAEDTGGAVKGNKIDLGFYDLSEGYWSRRWVTIYIVD